MIPSIAARKNKFENSKQIQADVEYSKQMQADVEDTKQNTHGDREIEQEEMDWAQRDISDFRDSSYLEMFNF